MNKKVMQDNSVKNSPNSSPKKEKIGYQSQIKLENE